MNAANVLPGLAPDELLQGHHSVLASFNELHSRNAVTAMVVSEARSRGSARVTTAIDALAALNDLTVDDLISRHSCYPVNHNVGARIWADRGASSAVSLLYPVLSRVPYVGWRMCPACIEDDRAEEGFAFWHRRHHVPGRYLCHLHGLPLLAVPQLPRLNITPSDLLASATPIHLAEHRARLAERPCVQRAVDILDRFLLHGIELEPERCRTALRNRVREHGGDASSPKWFAEFSSEMSRSCTGGWLGATLRQTKLVAGKAHNFAIGAFAPTPRLSHATVAIVAGMLFPSAEAACDALTSQ